MLRAMERPADAPSNTSALSADGFAAPGAFLQPEPPPDSTARMRHLKEWHKGLTTHVKQLSVHHGALSNLAEPLSEIYQLCHSALESSDHQNANGHHQAQRPVASGSRATDWMHSGDEADGGDTEPWGHDSRVDHLPHVSELKSKLRRGLEVHGQLCEDIKNLTDIKRTFHPLVGAQKHDNSPWGTIVHAAYSCARLVHEVASHAHRSRIADHIAELRRSSGNDDLSQSSGISDGSVLKTRKMQGLLDSLPTKDRLLSIGELKELLLKINGNIRRSNDKGNTLRRQLSLHIRRVINFIETVTSTFETIIRRCEQTTQEFVETSSLIAGIRSEKIETVASAMWDTSIRPIVQRLLAVLNRIKEMTHEANVRETNELFGENASEVSAPIPLNNDQQTLDKEGELIELRIAKQEFEKEKRVTIESINRLLQPITRPPILLAAERVYSDILQRYPNLKHAQLTLDVLIDSHRNSLFSHFTRLVGLDLSLTRRANGVKVTFASDWGRLNKQYRTTMFMFESAYVRVTTDGGACLYCESVPNTQGCYSTPGTSKDLQICDLIRITDTLVSDWLSLPSLNNIDEWKLYTDESSKNKRARGAEGGTNKKKAKGNSAANTRIVPRFDQALWDGNKEHHKVLTWIAEEDVFQSLLDSFEHDYCGSTDYVPTEKDYTETLMEIRQGGIDLGQGFRQPKPESIHWLAKREADLGKDSTVWKACIARYDTYIE